VLSRVLNMPSLRKGDRPRSPSHFPTIAYQQGWLQEIQARRAGLCRVRAMVGDVPRVEQSHERTEHG
jgi:hypothetical protein